MINTAFRLLLTFNATSLLIIIFLVQKSYTLGYFLADVGCLCWLNTLPNAVFYGLYILVPLLSTSLSILLSSTARQAKFFSFLPRLGDQHIRVAFNCAPRNYILAARGHIHRYEVREALAKSRQALESLTKVRSGSTSLNTEMAI